MRPFFSRFYKLFHTPLVGIIDIFAKSSKNIQNKASAANAGGGLSVYR